MGHLIYAARPLANDFLSTIFFVLLVALHVDPAVASALAIAIGVVHVLALLALRRAVPPLQWAGLGLVVVLGALGMLLHDARVLMAKPTVIYLILGLVMLKRGWMLRYMPPVATGHGEAMMVGFGYVWAALMIATGALNLMLVVWSPAAWPIFMAVFPTASKLVLFAIQFMTMRWIVRRRIIAARGAEPALAM
jgi:intracellular septation protein A